MKTTFILLEDVRTYLTRVDLYADSRSHTLHILDRDEPGTFPADRALNDTYMEALAAILEPFGIAGADNYSIYMYTGDGEIFKYFRAKNELQLIPLHASPLYMPFNRTCSRRLYAKQRQNAEALDTVRDQLAHLCEWKGWRIATARKHLSDYTKANRDEYTRTPAQWLGCWYKELMEGTLEHPEGLIKGDTVRRLQVWQWRRLAETEGLDVPAGAKKYQIKKMVADSMRKKGMKMGF